MLFAIRGKVLWRVEVLMEDVLRLVFRAGLAAPDDC